MKRCVYCMMHYEDSSQSCPYCGYSDKAQVGESLQLQPGSMLRERYAVGMVLGSGAYGATYIGWDMINEHRVAIKEYMPAEFATRVSGKQAVTLFKDEKKQKQYNDGLLTFLGDAEKLQRLPSDEDSGIVQVLDSFGFNNTGYIVMEYLEGETLANRLLREKTIPADEAVEMLMPIITSLQYVHQDGFIHGEIAPENIFLTNDGKTKIFDFSGYRYATTTHSRSLSIALKQGYSPEEQYRSRGDSGPHTDVFSIGAVLYRMITGEKPPDPLERRAFLEGKGEGRGKDIIKSIPLRHIKKNQAIAIMNALNVKIEARTPDTLMLADELLGNIPVKRRPPKVEAKPILKLTRKEIAAIAASTIAISAAIGLFALGFFTRLPPPPEGMTRVPSVVNQTLDHALESLDTANLLYSIAGREYSNNIPADYILSQNLVPGSIIEFNSIIELIVSGGSELKIVPIVAGEMENDARAALEELGFTVLREERFSDVIRAGQIISTSVEANSSFPVGET
ncbi:MAG: PASTA domain-containing protein, partial [Peptococcaceae bacterium]|nr:PASTA domain-containing protein [Peptococcaceae bacterium]